MVSTPRSTAPSPAGKRRPAHRCGEKPGIRKSKAGPWRTAVLLLVHLAIAAHIAHWLANGRTLSPLEPSEAMEYSKHGIVNAGLVFFALMIASTAVFGRWFCGWGCHLVALQDGSRWLLGKLGLRPRPFRSRLLLLVPWIAFGWMFLWPLWYRLRLGLGLGVHEVHLTTTGFWDTFPPWPVALATFLFSGFLLIWFLGAKGFCTYACPYGAIFGVADRLAPGRIRVTDACEGCGHCTAVCSSNVLVHAEVRDFGMVVDPGCMKCMDCVSVCPKEALYFGFGKPEILARSRVKKPMHRLKLLRWTDLSWREELLAGGLFLGAWLVYHDLFKLVPFLFSLAIAGIAAFFGLRALQLLYRPNVNLQGLVLKRNGRLSRAGLAFAGASLAGLGFTLWGAWTKLELRALDRGFEQGTAWLDAWWAQPGRALAAPERERVLGALEHGRRLERFSPAADPRLPHRLAVLELLAGDAPAFVDRLERAMTRDPRRALFPLTLAHYRSVTGEPEAALELYSRALELDPNLAAERQRVLDFTAFLGRPELGDAVLERALAAHPRHAGLLADLGGSAARGGRLELALGRFRAALEADPRAHRAREGLVSALVALDRLPEALEEQLLLVRRRPSDPGARSLAAELAGALGRWELCVAQLEALCRLDPDSPLAWLFLGQAHEQLGQSQEAARAFERARRLGPGLVPPAGREPSEYVPGGTR